MRILSRLMLLCFLLLSATTLQAQTREPARGNHDSFKAVFGDGRYGFSILQFALAPNGKVSSLVWENSDEHRFKKVVEVEKKK